MAHTFAIYGASDDLVEQELDGKGHDETGQPRSFVFLSGTKSLHAKLSYNGKKGTGWKLTVELQDEDEKGDLPFDVAIVQERYSPKLVVTAGREPVSVVSGSKKIATLTPIVGAKEIDVGTDKARSVASQDDCG
jgi:hypothetical protein